MCDTATLDLIHDTVEEKVRGDESFTAFDVSLIVKDKNPSIRHGDIKNDIHREMETFLNGGLYLKTLRDVGAPTPAFVYHPPHIDPSTYVPHKRRDTPKAQAPVSQNSVVQSVPAAPIANLPGRPTDARGALCVPVNLLVNLGFAPHDTAYVFADNQQNKPVLVIKKSAGQLPLTTYTVDYHGGVRITSKTLRAAGFQKDRFEFDSNQDAVLVKEA